MRLKRWIDWRRHFVKEVNNMLFRSLVVAMLLWVAVSRVVAQGPTPEPKDPKSEPKEKAEPKGKTN